MWAIEASPGPKVAYRWGWYHFVFDYTTAYTMPVFQMLDFGRSSALDPAGGANSAPPEPIGRFKGAYFR